MSKRPALKIGDVCRLSKRGMRESYLRSYCRNGKVALVVTGFGNPKKPNQMKYSTDDGRCVVQVTASYTYRGRRTDSKHVVYRKNLWFTGHNVNDGSLKGKSHMVRQIARQQGIQVLPLNTKPEGPQNNNGRTHCLKCGQPTTTSRGFMSDYQMCKNPKCEWYDN